MARNVVVTNQFKRDAKKQVMQLVTPQWIEAMNCLISGLPLPAKYENHPLKGGEWKDCMDCHIKPDLVLIYEFSGDDIILHRLGSHSELSLV